MIVIELEVEMGVFILAESKQGRSCLVTEELERRSLPKVQTFSLSMITEVLLVWQILSLCQRLVLENKTITQREGYYSLVQHFRSQAEFNNSLQGTTSSNDIDHHSTTDVVALTGCTRASLGICASGTGGVAGLLLWKVHMLWSVYPTYYNIVQDPDGDWEDCSTPVAGKRVTNT